MTVIAYTTQFTDNSSVKTANGATAASCYKAAQVGPPGSSTSSSTANPLLGKSVKYKVAAVNSTGEGAKSAELSVLVKK
jgi:hypothetical protein